MTVDQGKTWIDGERGADGAWSFGTREALVTILNADERCAPTVFTAWGIELGTIVKFPRNTVGPGFTEAPAMASVVVCSAYGKNEMEGTLKFPGTDFVVAFRGARSGDAWIGKSTEPRPLIGKMAIQPAERWRTPGFGGGLQAKPLWVIITKASVLVGLSRDPDLGHPDRIVDSFVSAVDFPRDGAKCQATSESTHQATRKLTHLVVGN